jgi:16S rRNA G966 N2-methylase RsmD
METNVIYCGDSLEVMPKYIPGESVDLIYIDPPFNACGVRCARHSQVPGNTSQHEEAGVKGQQVLPVD